MAYKYEKQLVELFVFNRKKELKLGVIVHYVYNENSSLFGEAVPYERLYMSVRSYLVRQSIAPNGLFEMTKRGTFNLRKTVDVDALYPPQLWDETQ